MKLLTGLFRMARKRVQTTDNDMGMFREKLTELAEKKDTLPDDEVVKRVEELKEMTADLPDEEEKAKLERFLEDFKSVKEQDGNTAKEAASMVADLFEKLDTEAMKDTPSGGEEEVEKTVKETVAPEGEEKTQDSGPGKSDVEKLASEATGDAEKPGANAEYTLEEIYQFCKKRRAEDEAGEAEDGCAKDGADVEKKKKEEEVVTDRAPRISVTMNGTPAEGSLAELFANIKKGGR